TLEIDLQRAIEGELKGPIFCLTHRHSTSAPPLIASKPTSVNDSARSYHTSSTPGKWKSGDKSDGGRKAGDAGQLWLRLPGLVGEALYETGVDPLWWTVFGEKGRGGPP